MKNHLAKAIIALMILACSLLGTPFFSAYLERQKQVSGTAESNQQHLNSELKHFEQRNFLAISIVKNRIVPHSNYYYAHIKKKKKGKALYSFNRVQDDGTILMLSTEKPAPGKGEFELITTAVAQEDQKSSFAFPTRILRKISRLKLYSETALPENQEIVLATFLNGEIARHDQFKRKKNKKIKASDAESFYVASKVLSKLNRFGQHSVIGSLSEDGEFTPLELELLLISGAASGTLNMSAATPSIKKKTFLGQIDYTQQMSSIDAAPYSEATCMCPLGDFEPSREPSPVCIGEPLFAPIKTSSCHFDDYGKPCRYQEADEPYPFDGGTCGKIGNFCGRDVYRPDCEGLPVRAFLRMTTPDMCAASGVVEKDDHPNRIDAMRYCGAKSAEVPLHWRCRQTNTISSGRINYTLEIEGSCRSMRLDWAPDPNDLPAYCSQGLCRIKIVCDDADQTTIYEPSEQGISCEPPTPTPTETPSPSETPTYTSTSTPYVTDTPTNNPTTTPTLPPNCDITCSHNPDGSLVPIELDGCVAGDFSPCTQDSSGLPGICKTMPGICCENGPNGFANYAVDLYLCDTTG